MASLQWVCHGVAWAHNDDVPASIQDPFMGINYRQPFDLTKTRINSCVLFFSWNEKEAVSKVEGRRNWPPLLSLLLALVLPECRKLVQPTRYLFSLTNPVRTHVHGPRGVCSNPPAERGRLSKPRPAETPKRDLFLFLSTRSHSVSSVFKQSTAIPRWRFTGFQDVSVSFLSSA